MRTRFLVLAGLLGTLSVLPLPGVASGADCFSWSAQIPLQEGG